MQFLFTPQKDGDGCDYSSGPWVFSTSTKCFSAEISELEHFYKLGHLPSMPKEIELKNTLTNHIITFKFDHADKDGSGEDTYGWRYNAVSGHKFPCSLLIIND